MSTQPRILIVEDDFLVALDLESIAAQDEGAKVTVCASVADARRVLDEETFDLAMLDIDVLDGKTFGLAVHLRARQVPFVFISGSRHEDVPDELKVATFLHKPCPSQTVRQTIRRMRRSGAY